MTRAQRLVLLALTLLGGAAFARTARSAAPDAGQGGAAVVGPGAFDWPELDVWAWVPAPVSPAPGAPVDAWVLANQVETATKGAAMNMTAPDPQRNVAAFLQAIAQAEGTANQADPYRVCYGYRHTIMSLREHPAITGEWRGERLTDEQCRGAGLGPGCVSTAAGKYQIIRPTWERLRDRLQLRDFGPASQDAAAVELLREAGALARIEQGDLQGAVDAARRTWASLPGAGYAGQGMRTLGYIQTAYLNAGGVLA